RQVCEESRNPDADRRLSSESLGERELVVSDPAGVAAGYRARPDRLGVTEQRHRHLAAVATGTSVGACEFGQLGIGLGVGDIDRRAIANGPGVRRLGLKRLWAARPQAGAAGG